MESLWNPAPTAEQSPEGWVITDQMDTGKVLAFIIGFPAIFIAVGVLVAVLSGNLFGLVFAGFGGLFLVFMLRQARVISRWRPGRLIMAEWPFELGGRLSVRFQREARRRSVGNLKSMEARLELAEVVRYTVGTDTRTDKEVILSNPLNVTAGAFGNRIEGTIEIEIPNDGPASMDLDNNRIEWWVVVDLDLDDAIDDDSRFKLDVRPGRR